jgi:hypothetical protein
MQKFCMVDSLRVRVLGAGPRVGIADGMTVSYPVCGIGPLDRGTLRGDLIVGDLNGDLGARGTYSGT